MIETKESRAEFEKRRAKAVAAFKSTIRGELPFSGGGEPVNSDQGRVEPKNKAPSPSPVTQPKLRNRAKYMREYRQRVVVCPKCGHEFKELKRKK